MGPISRRTTLINNHTAPIIFRGIKNGFIIKEFDVTIPAGGRKYVYYGDLNIEYNQYSPVEVIACLEGTTEVQTIVPTSIVRDNEALVFNYGDGRVTYYAIKGKLLARIGNLISLDHIGTSTMKNIQCLYSLVIVAEIPVEGLKGLGTKVIEEDD